MVGPIRVSRSPYASVDDLGRQALFPLERYRTIHGNCGPSPPWTSRGASAGCALPAPPRRLGSRDAPPRDQGHWHLIPNRLLTAKGLSNRNKESSSADFRGAERKLGGAEDSLNPEDELSPRDAKRATPCQMGDKNENAERMNSRRFLLTRGCGSSATRKRAPRDEISS